MLAIQINLLLICVYVVHMLIRPIHFRVRLCVRTQTKAAHTYGRSLLHMLHTHTHEAAMRFMLLILLVYIMVIISLFTAPSFMLLFCVAHHFPSTPNMRSTIGAPGQMRVVMPAGTVSTAGGGTAQIIQTHLMPQIIKQGSLGSAPV